MINQDGWKEVKVSVMPKCDLCDKDGIYDVPYIGTSWASVCEDHIKTAKKPNYAKSVGCKRILSKVSEPASGKVVIGIELTSLEDLINDEDREVECPDCNDTRTLEMDANSFQCSCGATVKCPSLI